MYLHKPSGLCFSYLFEYQALNQKRKNRNQAWLKSLFFLAMMSIFLPVMVYGVALSPEQQAIFQQLSPAEQQLISTKIGQVSPVTSSTQAVTDVETVKPRSTTENTAIQNNAQKATDAVDLKEQSEEKIITHSLTQFGYDLFAGTPSTFAPATDIPVPADYVIGPGDTILVQLYGKNNASYELLVNREGVIQFPEIGPLSVAGLSFEELKNHINEVASQQIIGVKASVTLGNLRSIRIFVLGEAYRPGSYTVSALSTITNALFASGGVTKVGSLRHVQLKRDGSLITELDLYD